MMHRAFSILEVKAVRDDQRIITGIATTPTPDRIGDIIEPLGVSFKNPMPLLLHHAAEMPVGTVSFEKPTKSGIKFVATLAKPEQSETLKARVDEAWESIKLGLVRGVSIGFKPHEVSTLKDGGIHFLKTEVLELSLVTVPAQAEATIQTIKSLDDGFRKTAEAAEQSGNEQSKQAALGRKVSAVVKLTPPSALGTTRKPRALEGTTMKTYAEQITALENKRAATMAAQETVAKKSLDDERNMNESESEEFDTLDTTIEAIDKDLVRLRKLEANIAKSAKPVVNVDDQKSGSEARSGQVVVKAQPKLEPGIAFARLVKVRMSARLTGETPLVMAQRMYGTDSEVFSIITKANEVVAGTTISGNWAYDLISQEGAAVAAFLEYLRPATIVGKFGVGGVPNLTRIDFYTPYVTETGGGDAFWIGEGKPKPLTAFDYDRSTLVPCKIVNIAVLTEENIRYSSPNSDMLVRNALVKAIAKGIDVAFIDPANSGTTSVKPASVTNGAETIVSAGDDADDIRVDVRSLFQKFIDANNPPSSGVWVMSATNALALSMMVNALGQPEFPNITMMGGTFQGLPVIVSQHISTVVALINTGDIFLGDEGSVAVDMSREASIEMRSTGLGMDATAGTATVGSVSMFQTNSVALRAERTISWKRARASAVAYLTSVDWGGAVNTA